VPMIINNNNEKICGEYAEQKQRYAAFCERMKSLFAELLKREGLKYHSITCRVKDENSLIAKLSRIDGKYQSLEQITDIAGVRIITYYADEVDSIAKLIENEFNVDEENTIDKRRALDPDRFGYISLHYIVTVDEKPKRLAKYKQLTAEVQIRSILQHTWAEIEHDLGYKNQYGVPKEIRRAFSRLPGLLELADKEFQEIRQSISEYTARVSKQMRADNGEILIDANSIELYINYDNNIARLNNAIRRINNASFKEDVQGIGSIVKELYWLGFKNIKDIDEALTANYDLALYLAQKILKGRGGKPPVDRTAGLFYLCYAVLAQEKNAAKIVRYWSDNKITVPGKNPRDNLRRAHQLLLVYESFLGGKLHSCAVAGEAAAN
jgi:ppGpp synthetase/RelA/SpoT-type nucleotidyltranferase